MTATARVRLLAAVALVVAAVGAVTAGWSDPAWWAVVCLAVLVGCAETAVVHLAFGRQRWTFSLTEAAMAAALVYRPGAWTAVAVAVGVASAQRIRRQERLKVEFN